MLNRTRVCRPTEMIMTIPLGSAGGGGGDGGPRKPKALEKDQGRLDAFVSRSAPAADESDVVLNEDGTMAGGGDMDDGDDFAMEDTEGADAEQAAGDDDDEDNDEEEQEEDVEEEADDEEPDDDDVDEDEGANTDAD
jgi:hypothetical protein